ncbi:MAG TPA: type IV pilus twitching motility protein PilT [Planctomycetota bacterium]|nr:type IV pilus twitching motility protein PilT [Planctomycetota bacterium]
MAVIDKMFRALKEQGGSDLHLQAGQPPKFRIHGRLEPLNMPALSNAEAEKLLLEILDERKKKRFLQRMDLDFAYEVPGVARFRCNFLRQHNGIGAVFRIIPTKIKTLEELDVPLVLKKFCELRAGLVLVTGPTGSGKSTTLAAMIDYINTNWSRHIITIEDPIEFVHENKLSVLTQREIGSDTESFARGLKAAAREDPDVILVGEMRDLETISLAITCAEMGNLVFGTLHTNSAAKTIDRIIDVFPEEQQEQIRTMLSVSLQGVCAQLLMRKVDGQGRVAVNEVLIGSSALSAIIREGAVHKIVTYIEGNRGEGMQLMDDSITQRLKAGLCTPNEAYMKALDKSRFEHLKGKIGREE